MRYAIAYASAAYRRPLALAAPVWTVAPAIIGTPQDGVLCTCSPGTYTGSGATLTYQWTLDGVDISLATLSTYIPITADVGHALRRRTVVTNATGSDTSTSAPVTVIAAASSGFAPASPMMQKPTNGVGSVTPRWLAPLSMADYTTPLTGVTAYRVYYGATKGQQHLGGAGTTAVDTPDANTFTKLITGLTGGTRYWFNVCALTGSLEGQMSGEEAGDPT